MSRKRQRRINETVVEFEKEIDTAASVTKLAGKTDDELFSLDRTGSKSAKKRAVKELVPKDEKTFLSKTETFLVKRTLSQEKREPYGKHKLYGGPEAIRDIWGTDDIVRVTKKCAQQTRTKKSRVALPGQSYNPTVDDHQNALAEALALEIKKKEKIEQQRTDNLIGSHNTDAVDLFEMGGSDDDGSDSEDDDDDDEEEVQYDEDGQPIVGILKRRKAQIKLTRAQRNRIKARNVASFEQSKEKGTKAISKLIDALPVILRTIDEEEQQAATRKLLKENQKKLAEEEKLRQVLTYEEAGTVPLSDELTGSLRTVIPKGVAVLDATMHMRQKGDLTARDRRKRKAYEKPHGDKNVVWIPKYKAVTK